MKGRPRKTSKRKLNKTPPPQSETTGAVSSPDTVPGGENAVVSQSAVSSSQNTPKRQRGQKGKTRDPNLTSTPVRNTSTDSLSNISTSPPGAKQAELKCTEIFTQLKTFEIDSPYSKSESRSKRASQPRQVSKRVTAQQTQTRSKTSRPSAKCRAQKTVPGDTTTLSSRCPRPRFELEKPDAEEQDTSLVSSDLSIELSHDEEQLRSLLFQEDEGSSDNDDDDEELPSFLMKVDKKPPSITKGVFVWYKLKNYPFWPALVKSVNPKQKKASIMFIDDPIIRKKKGFTGLLKNLKPYDCEEAKELVCKAREKYDAAIEWSMELIDDYRLRIACGSFSGSFIEYFAHDMSYPVRKKYPQAASERLTIERDVLLEEPCDDHGEDSSSEEKKVSRSSRRLRLLPDRTYAAHNRANVKLVQYIVNQRMAEERLVAVIHGQQQSRWLHSFLSASRRRVVNVYLEDDKQLDQVYSYLNELYENTMDSTPCPDVLKHVERVPFVLDVLLPEAIIYAIAGVDKISVKKAEEKYLKGRSISNREKQEFNLLIERQMKKKWQPQSIQ